MNKNYLSASLTIFESCVKDTNLALAYVLYLAASMLVFKGKLDWLWGPALYLLPRLDSDFLDEIWFPSKIEMNEIDLSLESDMLNL